MNTIQIGNVKIGEGPVKICVPLAAKTKTELMESAQDAITTQPDLIEWRVDFYHEVQYIGSVLETLRLLREMTEGIPLIFTCRASGEGGFQPIPNEFRFQLMKEAMKTKAVDLLDIELVTEKEDLEPILACAKASAVYVILSNHDFEKTPPVQSMIDRLLQAQTMGADIAKLAVMPSCPSDVLDLLYATTIFCEKHAKIPLITMSMSSVGLVSRVAGGVFGSCISFGAGREATAPGQIEVSKLRRGSRLFV